MVILPLLAVLLIGCAQVPVDFTRFTLLADRNNARTVLINEENFAEWESPAFKIDAIVYQYKQVVVAELIIINHADKDIEPTDYKITLTDGRDYKPLRLLTRDELTAIKNRVAGGTTGSMQDQVIEGTMNTILATMNVPTKDKLLEIIQQGIDNYFAFRPIYAKERRQGVLCYLPDFTLEYPLTVSLKFKQEGVDFRFMPIKNKGG